jgi:hypothetical protein
MELINQRDQARLILADAKYAPSKPCTVCGMPTRLGTLKCLHCLQAACLVEELAYTREWLLGHLSQPLVMGHDKHGRVHLALLRNPLLDVGWCGDHVSQKREKRKPVARDAFPSAVPEKFCGLCLAAFHQMQLVAS